MLSTSLTLTDRDEYMTAEDGEVPEESQDEMQLELRKSVENPNTIYRQVSVPQTTFQAMTNKFIGAIKKLNGADIRPQIKKKKVTRRIINSDTQNMLMSNDA